MSNPPNEFVMHGLFYAHRAMVRDVALLNSIASKIDTTTKLQRTQLRKWYGFFGTMMEHHHHAEDDLLFVQIERRLNQSSEVVEVMDVEHQRIQFVIDEIRRLISACEREEDEAKLILLKDELHQFTSELQHIFSEHIEKEEAYVKDNLTALFNPSEQKKIERRVQRVSSFKYMSYLLPWMKDSLSAEEYTAVLKSVSLPARLLNSWVYSKRYERLAAWMKEF